LVPLLSLIPLAAGGGETTGPTILAMVAFMSGWRPLFAMPTSLFRLPPLAAFIAGRTKPISCPIPARLAIEDGSIALE